MYKRGHFCICTELCICICPSVQLYLSECAIVFAQYERDWGTIREKMNLLTLPALWLLLTSLKGDDFDDVYSQCYLCICMFTNVFLICPNVQWFLHHHHHNCFLFSIKKEESITFPTPTVYLGSSEKGWWWWPLSLKIMLVMLIAHDADDGADCWYIRSDWPRLVLNIDVSPRNCDTIIKGHQLSSNPR